MTKIKPSHRGLLLAAALALLASPVLAQAVPAPDDSLTPGVARSDLTDAQIRTTKWGKDRRLVTQAMKAEVDRRYHITGGHDPSCGTERCEYDHRNPRACGGADVVENLFPQAAPYWHLKDRLEDYAARRVRSGAMTVAECQAMFMAPSDWRDRYREVFGNLKWGK